jgi:transcriptional regulator with XRE-family HTH domain
MAAIIEGLISNPNCDANLKSYADHERAHANRVVSAYFKTKLQFPQLSQREICSRIGVSNNTLAKYKHALGQPFRRSTVTTDQKMEAASKALVTRRRNQEYRAFLSELSSRGLSAEDTQREIGGWRRTHGLGELSASPTQPPASSGAETSSGNFPPFAGTGRSSTRKKRGGGLGEERRSGEERSELRSLLSAAEADPSTEAFQGESSANLYSGPHSEGGRTRTHDDAAAKADEVLRRYNASQLQSA